MAPDSPCDAPDATPGTSRLSVTRRTDKSVPTSIMHLMLRPIRPRLVKPRRVISVASPRLTPPKKASRWCHVTDRDVDGVWVYDLTLRADRAEPDGGGPPRRVVFFPGGGWQMPPSSDHWALAAEMVRRVPNTTVSLIAYPMAPMCPASVTMPRLRRLYDTLLQQAVEKGERVVFAGDSSGGNIALSLVTWALSESDSLAPAAIIAICPSTDLRHTHPDLPKMAKLDPLLSLPFINSTARAWSGGGPHGGTIDTIEREPKPIHEGNWSASDPRVSPVLANLEPLVARGVKVHGVTAGHDLLSVEALLFRERCRDESVEGEWLEWEGQMHCFPLAFRYKLRESVEAVDWVIGVLQKV